ncbi:MAG: lipocalin family protein [Paracoccaceae bacterium]
MALLLMAGCAAAPQVTGFRDPAVPIYSNAVVQPADLAGDWVQVANFATDGDCNPGAVTIAPGAAGLQISGALCLGGVATDVSGPYAVVGPGRLQRGADAPWWVIWADTNLRTLAIGTPDGRFGFVLNKGAELPQDRLVAAREVFDFNGYNPAGLRLR